MTMTHFFVTFFIYALLSSALFSFFVCAVPVCGVKLPEFIGFRLVLSLAGLFGVALPICRGLGLGQFLFDAFHRECSFRAALLEALDLISFL